MVVASSVVEKSVPWLVVFVLLLLVVVFVVIPFIGDRSARLWMATLAVAGAWALIAFTPIGKWTQLMDWLQGRWWVMMCAVVFMALLALVGGKSRGR